MKYLEEGVFWIAGTPDGKVLRQDQTWCIWGEARRFMNCRGKVNAQELGSKRNQRGEAGPNCCKGYLALF